MDGIVRPLSEYLTRYPGHEEAVAAAFVREKREAGDLPEDEEAEERRVGPYRLTEQLGQGGQGSVWAAEDTRIQRTVALKLLASLFVTEDRRARMRREAESVAKLNHPGVCPVLEAEVEGEIPYLAMPLLEGHDFAAELEQTEIPKDRVQLEQRLKFFVGAAEALHAAHEAGLVHRDIKPANVFVSPDGSPVLLDFGLARDVDDSSQVLTRSGEVFGTPAYMSPEQLKSSKVDGRTDVYSLAATLYEAVAGKRPFEGATQFELERAILFDPVPDPRRLNPTLPKDLVVVLETALEKERERRYSTAENFAADLRRLRQREPVLARPLGPVARAWRWAQREKAIAIGVLSTILALAIGLMVALGLLAEVKGLNSDLKDENTAKQGTINSLVAEMEEQPDRALLFALDAAHLLKNHSGRATLYRPLVECQLEMEMDAGDVPRGYDLRITPRDTLVGVFSRRPREDESGHGGLLVEWDLDSGEELRRLETSSEIHCIDLHPSGQVAVLGTKGGQVITYEFENERVLYEKNIATGEVLSVRFATRPSTLVALTETDLVRLNFPGGEVYSSHPLPSSGLAHVANGPSGYKLLVSPRRLSKNSESAWVLDLETEGWTEFHLGEPMRWVEWHPDGRRVLACGEAGTVASFDLSGKPTTLLELGEVATCLRPSSDGLRLAVSTTSGRVVVYDLAYDVKQSEFACEDQVRYLSWSPDDRRVACVSDEKAVRIFAVDRPREVARCKSRENIRGATWHPSGKKVFSWHIGPRVSRFGAGPMPYTYRLTDRAAAAGGFHGGQAWVRGADGQILRFDLERDGEFHALAGEQRVVRHGTSLYEAMDGHEAWVDGEGRLFVQFEGEHVREVPGVRRPTRIQLDDQGAVATWKDRVVAIGRSGEILWQREGSWSASSISANRVALGSDRVDLLDRQTGEAAGRIELDVPDDASKGVRWLEYDPKGERLALVRWYRPATPDGGRASRVQALLLLDAEGQALGDSVVCKETHVMWSPTGDALLGWFPGGMTRSFYRVDQGDLRKDELEVPGTETPFLHFAFHPSGDWLAGSTQGSGVLVWGTGEELPVFTMFPVHEGATRWVQFGPDLDDPRVLSAGDDGVYIWPIDPYPAALVRKPRELSQIERERYESQVSGE